VAKKPYKIVRDEIVDYMLGDFEGDFEGALRERLPTLEDAERIVPLERDPWRFDVEVEAEDRTWDVVSLLEKKANRLVVLGAYPKILESPKLTREEALAFIDAEIREGPREGMTGVEYVDSIRYIWKGLAPRDRRDP
jgi:hypothetical protein